LHYIENHIDKSLRMFFKITLLKNNEKHERKYKIVELLFVLFDPILLFDLDR